MADALSRLRRYRLRLIGGAVALVLVGALFWALRSRGPDPRIEAIRRQGYPATGIELDAWYRPVPETQNLALVYVKVFKSAAFTNLTGQLDPFASGNWQLARGEHLTPEDKAELGALLSTNETLLQPFYAAAGSYRYPVELTNGFNTMLLHLAACKAAVNTLTTAALLHADAGERDRALEDMAAAARVADSLREEPILISQLVRLASWGIIVKRVELLANLTSWNDAQLARMQKLPEAGERPQAMERAMVGERASGLDIFEHSELWFGWSTQNTTPSTFGERLRGRAASSLLKLSGFYAKDKAFYLNVMATNVAACQLPFPERLQAAQRASGLVPPSRFYIFSGMLLPALAKTFTREANLCAQLRATQTALAIERFRLAHANSLPVTLEELVPAYLSCAPVSPFDDKPLHYKPRSPGYVVYSLSADGIDHGGVEAPAKTPNAPHDITFILEK